MVRIAEYFKRFDFQHGTEIVGKIFCTPVDGVRLFAQHPCFHKITAVAQCDDQR